MSMTLNLVECLRRQGGVLQKLGLDREAARCWSRLAGLGNLPIEVSHEARTHLAEYHLRTGNLVRARRHLAAALAGQPGNPHLHYLLASAIEAEDGSDRIRALDHYRQAMELKPACPLYLCAFARLALELEQKEDGLTCLRKALELAPDDLEVVTGVVEGLHPVNPEEARRVIRAALFRNPRHAGFQKLWSDYHFQCLREEQENSRARYGLVEEPTLLPFVRPEPGTRTTGTIRRHAPSRPAPPHFPVFSGKKHA